MAIFITSCLFLVSVLLRHLVKTYCLPALFYGHEVWHLSYASYYAHDNVTSHFWKDC